MPAKAKGKYAAAAENAALHKALSEPVRGRILVVLTECEAGASELAELLDESFHLISYHLGKLREAGLIEVVRETTRRKRIYKATARPVIDLSEWEKLPRVIREINSAWVGQLIVGDMVAAIREGTFDERAERTMLRGQPLLDEVGLGEIEDASAEWLERVYNAEARSTERLAGTEEEGFRVSACALAFKVPVAERED